MSPSVAPARVATSLVCLLLSALTVLPSCAGGALYASKAVAAAAPMDVQAPPPLDHSLFARNPDGSLSEDDLQKIIDSPIELELPARVGVLPIVTAKDWRGPGPSFEVPAGAAEFAKRLKASEHFTLVTAIMPIPSGSLGMEALREMAARYRLRYIILYRESYRHRVRANGWAAGYVTLIGALFLPGSTLSVDGYLEASMFDVKTGLFMFTVRRAVSARKTANEWHEKDKLESMEVALATKFAPELASDVWNATTEFAAAIDVENEQRKHRAAPEEPPAAQQAASESPTPL